MSAIEGLLEKDDLAPAREPAATMKAVVYRHPGLRAWEEVPRPVLQDATDAIVRITTTTICGTDLHILEGGVPTVTDGRILGHEGVGVVEEVGAAVSSLLVGRKVLVSCITSCGRCDFCRRGMYSQCRHGGWILGNTIHGTQAEYVRIAHAETSLHPLPPDADEEATVMLSDVLPTGFECGVLNGQVKPGDSLAIVGAGPVGLAALLTAQLYSPAEIVMVDVDENRLALSRSLGATHTVDSGDGKAVETLMELTDGAGFDVAIEAASSPATFDVCQSILAPGGRLANVGVHGQPVVLRLDKLWSRNVTLTTRLVDTVTTPMLLGMVLSGRLRPQKLVSHRFDMADVMSAYDTFGNAAKQRASKVLLRVT